MNEVSFSFEISARTINLFYFKLEYERIIRVRIYRHKHPVDLITGEI